MTTTKPNYTKELNPETLGWDDKKIEESRLPRTTPRRTFFQWFKQREDDLFGLGIFLGCGSLVLGLVATTFAIIILMFFGLFKLAEFLF